MNDFPLMLQARPAKEVRRAVKAAVESLTLFERMKLGPDLPNCIGLRAEALLAKGIGLRELDELLNADDIAEAAEIVRPYLTRVVS